MAVTSLEIKLSGGFRMRQLERLIAAIEPMSQLGEPRQLLLDMSGLAFITPTCLATLSAVLSDRLNRGLIIPGSTYVSPKNRLVEMYLARMDFHKLFSGEEVKENFVRRPEEGFTPCLWLASGADKDSIADSLTMATCKSLSLGGSAPAAVWLAISEMAQNVLDHAQSAVGGFAAAQTGRKREEFEIAIADAGVGIKASLGRNQNYAGITDDLSAIRTALEPGVTSNPGPNTGVGLSMIRQAIRENGGALLVRSGTAAIESGQIEREADGLELLHGTLVALRIRRDRPFALTLYSGIGHASDPSWRAAS